MRTLIPRLWLVRRPLSSLGHTGCRALWVFASAIASLAGMLGRRARAVDVLHWAYAACVHVHQTFWIVSSRLEESSVRHRGNWRSCPLGVYLLRARSPLRLHSAFHPFPRSCSGWNLVVRSFATSTTPLGASPRGWCGRVRGSVSPWKGSYLVDPASSHMLVSKIKPCMSKYKLLIL